MDADVKAVARQPDLRRLAARLAAVEKLAQDINAFFDDYNFEEERPPLETVKLLLSGLETVLTDLVTTANLPGSEFR